MKQAFQATTGLAFGMPREVKWAGVEGAAFNPPGRCGMPPGGRWARPRCDRWRRPGRTAACRLGSVGPARRIPPGIGWACLRAAARNRLGLRCGAVRCLPIDRGRIGAYRQAPAGPVRGRLSEVFRAEEWYIGDRCTMHAYAHARCLYEERPTTGSAGVWRNLR